MNRSIKFRIISWYVLATCSILFFFGGCMLNISNKYLTETIRTELKNEVFDFISDAKEQDEIPKHFADFSMDVRFILYNNDMEILSTCAASKTLHTLPFQDNIIQEISTEDHDYFVYDASFSLTDSQDYHIRGYVEHTSFLDAFFHSKFDPSTEYVNNEMIRQITRLEHEYETLSCQGGTVCNLLYYQNGISLGIYDSTGKMIHGMISSEFDSIPFTDNQITQCTLSSRYYLVYDQKYDTKQQTYYIRAVSEYGILEGTLRQLFKTLLALLLIAIFPLSIMCYFMLKKILKPVADINKALKSIQNSSDLSLRLEKPNTHDELTQLIDSCNDMLDRIEDSFVRERQFSSDIAHELKTPIAVVMSHCEYSMKEFASQPEIINEFLIIYQKAERLNNLITQLLTLVRIENGRYKISLEALDLNMIIETVQDELDEQAKEKNITFETILPSTPTIFNGDMALLTSMIMNLIKNAIKYGRENGYVHTELRKEKSAIRIIISDNGIGISQEDLPNIWNRLYRADKSRNSTEGYGLGLFMVRWIVEIHHGTITASSKLGQGSTFTVTLPIENQ